MNIAVRRKFKSESGASLTFALLVFLVCAVIGVIILTAGTVASGRLAEKAKMDQRYYRVISAVDVLKDELNDKKVVIIRKKVTDPSGAAVYSVMYEDPGFTNPDTNIEEYERHLLDVSNVNGADFLTQNTVQLLNPEGIYNDSAVWNSNYYNSFAKKTYQLNVPKGSEALDPMEVALTAINGILELEIGYDNYFVKMTLSPDISEVVSIKENADEEKIEIKSATITWYVTNIEKEFVTG